MAYGFRDEDNAEQNILTFFFLFVSVLLRFCVWYVKEWTEEDDIRRE